MNIQLYKLAFFANLQGALEALSVEDLKQLRGGGPLPKGAVVIGEMSIELKALCCLFQRADNEYEVALGAGQEKATINKLSDWADFLEDLFWAAFDEQYLEQARGAEASYGPNFEVYII